MDPYTLYYNFFFFNDTATTEIYTLSLHDALPIWNPHVHRLGGQRKRRQAADSQHHQKARHSHGLSSIRSEEHTSELQSRLHLVCRLLLEKKKTNTFTHTYHYIVKAPF